MVVKYVKGLEGRLVDEINVQSITKKFGRSTALDHVSLNIKGMYGLLGPNGAGKTTLMRILAALIPATDGNIHYGNLTWKDHLKVKQKIGYLPQHFSMYKNLKVKECLDHFAVLKGVVDRHLRKKEIENVLYRVNLSDQAEKRIKQLSGGMLRRVGIAQALLGGPEILIIDEPTAGLDVEERVRFRKLLRNVGQNKIVIISTHIVDDLEFACDYIGVLNGGKVLAEGSRADIADFAKECVWEMEIPVERDLNMEFDESQIISVQQKNDAFYFVRVLSKTKPSHDAYSVKPRLEDGYLALIRGETKNE